MQETMLYNLILSVPFVFVLALYVLFHTGCRPEEAAYIVQHKSVYKNVYPDFLDHHNYTAASPADYNKTDRDYLWLLPKAMNIVLESVLFNLPPSPFIDEETFTRALDYWFGKVMKETKLPREDENKHKYTMRSVRCYRATEWVKKRAECEIIGDLVPPNPL